METKLFSNLRHLNSEKLPKSGNNNKQSKKCKKKYPLKYFIQLKQQQRKNPSLYTKVLTKTFYHYFAI